MNEASKLLRHHDEGRITWTTLVGYLCQAAAETPPESLAEVLPAEVLAEIRKRSAIRPVGPEGCWVFTSSLGLVVSRRLFDGLCRWHDYFANN